VGKRGSLSTFAAEKPGAARPAEQAAPEKEEQRGQTLRLNVRAWRQLKALALEAGKPSHDLLIEAVNDLFQKRGKPPIA
jgi:antitoxin-like ribbon-helix-helix protein